MAEGAFVLQSKADFVVYYGTDGKLDIGIGRVDQKENIRYPLRFSFVELAAFFDKQKQKSLVVVIIAKNTWSEQRIDDEVNNLKSYFLARGFKRICIQQAAGGFIRQIYLDYKSKQNVTSDAKGSLQQIVKSEEYRGSLLAQARLDGIDYRSILARAIRLDSKALESLFEFRFMGEGAHTHCVVLGKLMELWGDERFSRVLSVQPKKIKNLVVASIDFAWVEPKWDIYPKTFATSPTSVGKRPKDKPK